MNPWPRQFSFRVVLVLVALAAALAVRAPRRFFFPADLHDSVTDHRAMLSAGHASLACAACHISHPAKASQPLWQKSAAADSMLFARDSQSAGAVKSGMCLSCHDGTVAANLAHSGSGGGMMGMLSNGVSGNHPVGVDYAAAVRRDPMSYNDASSNARIILEDGKVGCVSCHATHDLSSVGSSNVRHEVCIECHRR